MKLPKLKMIEPKHKKSMSTAPTSLAGSLKMKTNLGNSRKTMNFYKNFSNESKKKSKVIPINLDEGNIFDGSLFDLDNVVPLNL